MGTTTDAAVAAELAHFFLSLFATLEMSERAVNI